MKTSDFKALPVGAIVHHENSKSLCTYVKIAHKKWQIKGTRSGLATEGGVIPQSRLLKDKGEPKRAANITMLFDPSKSVG